MLVSAEKRIRKQLIASFDPATLRQFYEPEPWRVLWTFAHIWLGLLVSVALAVWIWRAGGLALALIPAVVFYVGTRHNALAVQIHEASHNLLFARRSWNDAFCNVFGAYWVFNDVASYRKVHVTHHTDLHLDTDPDRDLYLMPAAGGRFAIARLVLQDLLWVTALRRIRSYIGPEPSRTPNGRRHTVGHALAKVACQGALLVAACTLVGWMTGPLFYLVFWVVPLFSVFPAIVRLRTVTEHFSPALHATGPRPFVSRTTSTHPVEIYLFGCDMEYHFEHHLLPAIPHSKLARLHAALVEKGFFDSTWRDDALSGGYVRFWSRLLAGNLRHHGTPALPPRQRAAG